MADSPFLPFGDALAVSVIILAELHDRSESGIPVPALLAENSDDTADTDSSLGGSCSNGDDDNNKKEKLRRKPGKRGEFKGRDALRRENKMARDAGREAGLNRDQQRQLHDAITGQDLQYPDIVDIARSIKNGSY